MMKAPFPYDKFNFLLTVFGFVGTVILYVGVLQGIKKPDREEIKKLEYKVDQLQKKLEHSPDSLNLKPCQP